MNPEDICVHPRSSAVQPSQPPAASDPALWLCALLAIAAHGALLFAWKYSPEESAAAMIEGNRVEVALVESAPAAAVASVAEPQPPAPAVVPPEQAPIPTPEPKREPEMVIPETPKPTPPPRTSTAATPSPRATPKPALAKGTPSPRTSVSAGTTGGASAPTGTAAGGAGAGRIAKASYITRPIAAYPPESRTAGEQGTVILRLTVDGSGRPTAVGIAKSSGFPRLDRAATEAGWRCRVRDAAPGSHLEAPVRFNLSDR